MTTRWTKRLTRLIRADAHGLLETLEDRALLLKQHLREAELELQRKRARLAALDEEENRVAENAARCEHAVAIHDRDTRMALAGGREDLARFAIRKLLPRRSELESLRARIAEIRGERDRLAPLLAAQEAEFEELRARTQERIAAEARAEVGAEPPAEWRVADEEVEMELLRRTRSEGGTA